MEDFTEEELDISFWLDEQIYVAQEDLYGYLDRVQVTTYDDFIYHLKTHSLFCLMIIYKDKTGTSLKQQIDCHWNYYLDEYKKN